MWLPRNIQQSLDCSALAYSGHFCMLLWLTYPKLLFYITFNLFCPTMMTFLDVLISRPVSGDQRKTLTRLSPIAVTLAKVSDGDGVGSCQHSLHRKVVSSESPKIPRYSGSLGVRTHYSPKDAEIVQRGIKHRKTQQDCIIWKPVSSLLQTGLAVCREDFFDIQM